jgi:hypothetical protein
MSLSCFGDAAELEERLPQSDAHSGKLGILRQSRTEHFFSFLQVTSQGPRYFTQYLAGQGVYRGERGVEFQDDLDLLLHRRQEEERPHHALGLPPPGGV